MKEIRAIIQAYQSIDLSKTKAVLATVARVEGSSYRRTGARMLVLDDGTYLGGISGGCLEGDALRRAQKAIYQDKVSLVTYDTTEDDGHQIGVGLGCNGIIDVLFTPLSDTDDENPVTLLSTITGIREPAVIVWITGCEPESNVLGKALKYDDDESFLSQFGVEGIASQVLDDVHKCRQRRASTTRTYQDRGNEVKVFIEVIMPVTQLVLYGSNYDLNTMVRTASELGWEVTIVANPAKIDKSLFSLATKILPARDSATPKTDSYTAVMLMSHDYKTDFDNLQKILLTEVTYIGILGPRKRTLKMLDALSTAGKPVSENNLERIFSPAGLDIGASTPEEIALSIAAEIRSHFANRPGSSLRKREGTIYDN